ncbi:FtsW/RodA/SpoVE family cell cycle protein [Candidatus Kaiserbacteria bacterium]|nr:FtsW/RodA/SpoVE family cell cycle protein [Candidatus Kaiserbacteria bacterium]
MPKRKTHIDRPLIILLAILLIGGCFIFASAAFGYLARSGNSVSPILFGHLVLGVGFGLIALIMTSTIDYHTWRRFAPHFFALALLLTAAVFLPHIGAEHGGGQRWLYIWRFSLQPSEILKLAAIIMAAAYFSHIGTKVQTWRHGLLGIAGILALPVLLLLLQPDLGTLGIICIAVLSVFWMAGGRMRDIILMTLVAILLLGALVMTRPYVRDRVMTFIDPSAGAHAEGYQIKQSLIAIGSGGITGRGWGQGIQKFSYLPEPMGDSIFAVAGEELGFIGTIMIVGLFLAFALRGFFVATHASDLFGTLIAAGISTYLVIEAFINIASMLGIAPLTGVPLTFISQGGSAMLVSLASAGILLNVSRHQKKGV